jgi:hypothetical protein
LRHRTRARPYSGTRIGLDLDNTLITYDHLFYEIALHWQFIPSGFSGTKREIRDAVRRLPDGEREWQRLQAEVYGPAIGGARVAEGASDFVRDAREGGAELAIVSHKSTFAHIGTTNVDMREAARIWLRSSGLIGPDGIAEDEIYFEDTRARKIARIVSLRCTHFVDDLEEVFEDAAFPAGVERLLLGSGHGTRARPYRTYASFREIARAFSTA